MDTTNRRFRSGTLEKDFFVLFGEKSKWKWPFGGDGIVGTIISLGVTTFLASLCIGIFFHFHLSRDQFAALAGVVFVWETLRNNWGYLRDSSVRNKLKRKYLPIVQNTEAFELLEEAIASRRKGIVDGLGSKEETEAELIRLWKASFMEADSLLTVQSPHTVMSDPLAGKPVGAHIHRYFEERAASYQEIGG